VAQASLSKGLRLFSSTIRKSRGPAEQVRATQPLKAQWMLPRRTALIAMEQEKRKGRGPHPFAAVDAGC
jgi:hypothetical protein